MDALERAIAVLKKQAYDRKQGESLAQVAQLQLIPEHAKKVIGAFLAQGDELGSQDLDVTAPEANAYEFQCASSAAARISCRASGVDPAGLGGSSGAFEICTLSYTGWRQARLAASTTRQGV